jgi:hypothetical protein
MMDRQKMDFSAKRPAGTSGFSASIRVAAGGLKVRKTF